MDRSIIKAGDLSKLGGKQKNKWENRHFQLSASGLSWKSGTAGKGEQLLAAADIEAVAIWSDIGVHHAFEIATKVKSGKVYKFNAKDDEERDAWMAAIGTVIQDFRVVEPTTFAEGSPPVDLVENPMA
eukprot:SAG31_NODE_22951_length_514_cov_1.231325_1_plen_127_part_10